MHLNLLIRVMSLCKKSQWHELCGNKRRKKQVLQNKRELNKRERENNYDLFYKNECQNWYSKINKAKKTAGFPADRLAGRNADSF